MPLGINKLTMGNNHNDKLILLQKMIELAKVDGKINEDEKAFLFRMADFLNISEIELNTFIANGIDKKLTFPKTETDRIFLFQSLLLMTGVDFKWEISEINFCIEIGMFLGLNPDAVRTLIQTVKNKNGEVVSPEEVIKIFKVAYN